MKHQRRQTPTWDSPAQRYGCVGLLLIGMIGSAVAANSPTIKLFPETTIENIKQASQSAKQMENSLGSVIGEMDQQFKLYKESKCDGSVGDPGCDQIQHQLSEKYMQMLSQMESELDVMEPLVTNMKTSIETRIRNEIGRKMTPRDMQKMLAGKKSTPSVKSFSGKRRTGRMSTMFKRYHQLVSRGSAADSLAQVASEIYLDSAEVIHFISLTRQEIARAKISNNIVLSVGRLTPQMIDTVNGVKSIIFGDDESISDIGEAPEADPTDVAAFVSEWEE